MDGVEFKLIQTIAQHLNFTPIYRFDRMLRNLIIKLIRNACMHLQTNEYLDI